jgi:hypothetical protein
MKACGNFLGLFDGPAFTIGFDFSVSRLRRAAKAWNLYSCGARAAKPAQVR